MSPARTRSPVDADVEQQLGAVVGAQCQRMLRRRDREEFAVTWSAELAAGWIDRHAVAEHSACEDRVRDLGQRQHPAGHGCGQ
jgi:hypothetical protein